MNQTSKAMTTAHLYAQQANASQDCYDFSGPLWKKYHSQTRKKVRFPRGYKEVSLLANV